MKPPKPGASAVPPDKVPRRDFLRALGAGGLAALTFHPWEHAMAGPFTRTDFDHLVPADKKLSPEWVAALTTRGERTTYRGASLQKIGMPIGGLCAGQLYLGGDGRLWHWDLFNQKIITGAEHYAHPPAPRSPLEQGFELRLTSGGQPSARRLAADHWNDVSFTGEYPIGYVTYADPTVPVTVRLEAFSPFTPLNIDDSSLPATVLEFTIQNPSANVVEGELAGWLENAVCLYSAKNRDGRRRNRLVRERNMIFLECSAEDVPSDTASHRPDLVFDDFESGTYRKWTGTGTAFGTGPAEAAQAPAYQGDLGAQGQWLVNSHTSAPGDSVEEKDRATGRLLSQPFVIERNYINFLIGGGDFAGRTCLNLRVNDQVVLSATGHRENHLRPQGWDVRPWAGQSARLEIVDAETGPWGNIGVDDIVFSDQPRSEAASLAEEADFGTLGLALLEPRRDDLATTALAIDSFTDTATNLISSGVFSAQEPVTQPTVKNFGQPLIGALGRPFKLAPGESVKVTFLLSWFMPNLKMDRLPPGRFYATKFNSARAVAAYLAKNLDRLAAQTRLWHDTWYASTLPYWFLDRTFLNTSILATSSCFRFGNGRFYSWEGVGCCAGTCGHVWHYAQAVGRLFPELERILREQVDFAIAQQPDGAIHFRAEFNNIPAIDGQAGVILRSYREHQMSADAAFLKRNWPRIKLATQWLIAKDGDGDGLIESNQHNTLDTDWYGRVAWLSGLYLSALSAAAAMADEVGDQAFSAQCRQILTLGQKNFVDQLFDDDYFVNRVDPQRLTAINSGTGCEIDQVMGQSWAFQVGLPRVWPAAPNRAALESLWRYNFSPDVGPYRDVNKPGRWYALPGEAGLLMCTFPRTDWDYARAKGRGPEWAAGYFNECMNGFEYEVAGHMLWEGMITEGLAVARAVHDRYHASRRNPWNEVECGDHYVRSLASHGIFLAACGFEYHGPQGRLAFAPRLTPENFQAPFTSAAGWGTYAQQQTDTTQTHQLTLKYGELRLTTLGITLAAGKQIRQVKALQGTRPLAAQPRQIEARVEVQFAEPVHLTAGETLTVTCELA